MKRIQTLGTVVAAVLLCSIARAQGADNCANAQVISGPGPHAFDNTSATTDGPADCLGQPTRRDVWFAWTAPTTDSYLYETCGQTSLGTRIAVYDGTGCPPTTQLACNGNGCFGGQSRVTFDAVTGQQYLLRLGSRMPGTSGTGTFTIEPDPCPPSLDDYLEDNDSCPTAVNVTDGTYPGLWMSRYDVDNYEIHVAAGTTVTIDLLFTHALGNINAHVFLDCGVTVLEAQSASDDEHIIYTNATGCTETLHIELWLLDPNSDCNNYDMVVNGSIPGPPPPCTGIGTNYCTSTPNSTGSAAVMSASGSTSVAANSLHLISGPVPQQPGLFFYGPNQISMPFGNGTRCVGGTIIRLPVITPVANQFDYDVDNTALPPSGAITPGSTWNFQCWFRDPPGGGAFFDLSDGLEVLFTP